MTEPSFQELRRLSASHVSAARGELVHRFSENLQQAPASEGHKFLYSVAGQGGTGKTRLLVEFRDEADRVDARTAWIDESHSDALEAMRALVPQFGADAAFATYLELDRQYIELSTRAISDPSAPPNTAGVLGRAAGRTALLLGRQLPGIGLAMEIVPEEAVLDASSAVAAYLANALKDQAKVGLLLSPLQLLSRAFVEGLTTVCADGPAVIFIDGFERSQPFVEPWLSSLMDGEFGATPLGLIIAVAGQVPLSYTIWSDLDQWIDRVQLDVFSEDEARAFLRAKGIISEPLVVEMMRLTNRLPVLLATLASQSPTAATDLSDTTGTAVEVFLKWIEDPDLREVAMAGALPRLLNEDTLRAATGRDETDAHLEWLLAMPFVQERTNGWTYHPVVRAQLVRHLRNRSPTDWRQAQQRLREWYHDQEATIARADGRSPVEDPTWEHYELEHVYHALITSRPDSLEAVIGNVVGLTSSQSTLAEKLATAVHEAGVDMGDPRLQRWGRILIDLAAGSAFETSFGAVSAILDSQDLNLTSTTQARLLRHRFVLLSDRGDYADALVDIQSAQRLLPGSSDLIIDEAIALLNAGSFEASATRASDVLAAISDDKSHRARATILGVRGEAHSRLGRTAAALEDYDEALSADPDDQRVLHRRAQARAQEGLVDEAASDIRRAIELDKNFAHTGLQRLGRYYSDAGRTEEARAALVESLAIEPSCGHCWDCLVAITLDSKGEAGLDELRSTEVEPVIGINGLIARGRALGEAGAHSQAAIDFAAASERGLSTAEHWNSLGVHLACGDQVEDGLKAIDTSLELDPAYFAAMYNRVVYLHVLGRSTDNDLAALESVLPETDEEIATYVHAALSLMRGDQDNAIATLDDLESREPELIHGFLATDIVWTAVAADDRFQAIAGRRARPVSASSPAEPSGT